ncbi:MAG: putative manganese transporter, partial [Ignavibacteria bacterium]|nr:putative manganese transporter [Ignavibacteria bacterium]
MLQQTFIITTFVMGMMMVIEYLNVQTRGLWSNSIQQSPFTQIILGSLMGIIPGCLGSYTMVSLYVHRVVMFPAIVATMIATSGDEAFLMFSLIPMTAIKLNIILLVIAIVSGIIVHFTVKNKYIGLKGHTDLPLHEPNEECNPYHPRQAIENIRNISFTRALLIAGIVSILIILISGIVDGSHHLNTLMGGKIDAHDMHAHDGHDHHAEADWIRISLIALLSIILYIVTTAKEHFLQEHLWHHIIRKHFIKIVAWTLG